MVPVFLLALCFKVDAQVTGSLGDVQMDEREFHCKGEFKGVHKGRPNEDDLKAAAEFAGMIVK